jgi:hypothetical protein
MNRRERSFSNIAYHTFTALKSGSNFIARNFLDKEDDDFKHIASEEMNDSESESKA